MVLLVPFRAVCVPTGHLPQGLANPSPALVSTCHALSHEYAGFTVGVIIVIVIIIIATCEARFVLNVEARVILTNPEGKYDDPRWTDGLTEDVPDPHSTEAWRSKNSSKPPAGPGLASGKSVKKRFLSGRG